MLELFFDVQNLRLFLALAMLSIGTIEDIRKREISDFLWIVFAAFAVIVLFFETDIYNKIFEILISLIIAPMALLFWRFGLFGGADSFALIVLAALVPQVTFSENFVTPLTTLTNAAILSSIPFFANFTVNIAKLAQKKNIFEGFEESNSKKILAMFLGRRVDNPKFSFLIEKKVHNVKKFHFVLHHAENTPFCSQRDSWVTHGVPYLIFISFGFVIQLLFGDILLNLFNQ